MIGKYIAWIERTTGGRSSFASAGNLEHCIIEANKQIPRMNLEYIRKIGAPYRVVITEGSAQRTIARYALDLDGAKVGAILASD